MLKISNIKTWRKCKFKVAKAPYKFLILVNSHLKKSLPPLKQWLKPEQNILFCISTPPPLFLEVHPLSASITNYYTSIASFK